jgi:two-component system response regulator AtoC
MALDKSTEEARSLGVDRPARQVRLLVLTPSGSTAFDLPVRGEVRIGRSSDASVPIDDPAISRHHLTLHMGGSTEVEDAGSANGTRVDGKRLPKRARVDLHPGQMIEMGSTLCVLIERSAEDRLELEARSTLDLRRRHPSSPMERVRSMVARVARSDISILLLGETGSGKGLLAEEIHRASQRAAGPFVALNCAAISESLLEGELFGFERGAFTGAVQGKRGQLESAEGGTLLLDEVGELTPAVQAKLLRVIENREVLPLGSLHPRKIDVRLVSATNRELEREVERGTFRRDLYFRLNGISLRIPALRERPDEIEALAHHLVAAAARAQGIPPPSLAPAALEALRRHPWPGNVRELRNALDRALVLCGGDVIHVSDLALSGTASLEGAAHGSERQRVVDALQACAGNQSHAAKLLGISRQTLVNWIQKYGIARPRRRP